jgi:hypothetical protein
VPSTSSIEPGGGDLQPGVVGALDLQHLLQLAGQQFAIVHGDELARLRVGLARQAVDRDAQQPTGRPFDVDQVVAHARHSAFNRLGGV